MKITERAIEHPNPAPLDRLTTRQSAAPLPAGADAVTAAVILLHQDARRTREMARQSRHEAQERRIGKLQEVAGKLRQMANMSLASGLFQGALSLGTTACSLAGTLGAAQKGGEAMSKTKAAWLKVGTTACQVLQQIDPFAIREKGLRVEQQELEIEAERRGNRAQDHGDSESEARRVQESAVRLLQQTGEARHAARMATLKV